MMGLKDLWQRYGSGISFFGLALAVIATTILSGIVANKDYRLDEDLLLHVDSNVNQIHIGKSSIEAGGLHELSGNNYRDPSENMTPLIEVKNTSKRPRDVTIHSRVGKAEPIAGTLHLEPGQKFEFRFETGTGNHSWFCWLTPQPPVKKK